jgi:hypothetical protein
MSKLREMLSDVEYETVKIWCKPIPFPVRLILPDEAKETMPLALVKSIEGIRISRPSLPGRRTPPRVSSEGKPQARSSPHRHDPVRRSGTMKDNELRLSIMEAVNLFDEISSILGLLDSLERLFENNCFNEAHCLFGLLSREIEPKAHALAEALNSARKAAFQEVTND